jgi:hypothetical protein
MSKESRLLAGILLITFPTVVIGGVSLLSLRGEPPPRETHCEPQEQTS